jgi:hypothetical protein
VEDKYSDEAIQKNARNKLRAMLLEKSFMERWKPVAKELEWALGDREDVSMHQTILPDYCYNIFDLLRRTTFSAFPTKNETVVCPDKSKLVGKTISEAKQHLSIDWEKMGALIGIRMRGMRFFDLEAEAIIKEEGLADLSEDESIDLGKLIGGEGEMEKLVAEIQALDPGKPLEQILESQMAALKENTESGITRFNQWAYQWGPDAMSKLNAGMAKGASGFLDEQAELKGERRLNLSQTYWFLLITWPEIDGMIKAKPQKRLNDLWDWLTPFSYAGWIEVKDLEQLISLCRPIKLKLKKPGAPAKTK